MDAIPLDDIAHTSATLMYHINTEGDLWSELYSIANANDKGWLELTWDIGKLAIAYETYWNECSENQKEEFHWLDGILELVAIMADHYKNDATALATVKAACARAKAQR